MNKLNNLTNVTNLKIEKKIIADLVLWLSLLLAMIASIQHLAYVFGTVEQPGKEYWGWVPAIASDASLASLAYVIQIRKKLNKSTMILWIGVVFFAIISLLANFYYALMVESIKYKHLENILNHDFVIYTKAFVLSAILPIMYIFLGEVVGNHEADEEKRKEEEQQRIKQDEQKIKDKEERDAKREQQKLDNEAKQLEIEQQKILLEQLKLQQETTEKQKNMIHCEKCGKDYKNRQAYAAHICNRTSDNKE